MGGFTSADAAHDVRTALGGGAKPGKGAIISDDIGLMFSGGLDSTLTAIVLSERFQRVHLVTYCMGRGLWFMNNSRYHMRELKEIIGEECFTNHLIDNSPIFSRVRKGFFRDYIDYCNNRAPFIYCMKCKLAMHARSIIYCLENGLKYWADGAIEEQNDRPEMMPGVLRLLEKFYAQYDIEFSSPIYHFGSRDDERRELLKRGFTLGLRTGDLHKTVQPFCLPGAVLAYWHYSAYPREDDVLRFVKDKLPLLHTIIRDYFKDKEAVPEAIQRLLNKPLQS